MKTITTCSAALLATVLATGDARAFTHETVGFNKVRWPHTAATLLRVDSTLSADDRAGIAVARDAWNQSGVNFTIHIVADNDGGFGTPNFESEIVRTRNHFALGGSPAVALWWWEPFTASIQEADILINDDYGNPSCSGSCNGGVRHVTTKSLSDAYRGGSSRYYRPLAQLMIHELGHAIGLRHENRYYSVMGMDATFVHSNGTTMRAYVGADSTLGAAVLYGFDTSVRDVSAVHWRYAYASGEYSQHARTRLFSAGGAELSKALEGREPVYTVRRGHTVQAEFTFENNGAFMETVTPQYLLSTNDAITTADTVLLTSFARPLPPGAVVTQRHAVTIPAGTSPGRYALGVRLIKAGSESNTANNATYVRIDVVN